MANRAERVITCSAYMREHVADIYGARGGARDGDPERDRPRRPRARRRPRRPARRASPQPDEKLVLLVGRLVYEKGFQLALEALPGLIERVGNVRFLVAGSGTHEQELRAAGQRARARRARHVPRLDRRRRAALALPDRRPHGGAVDLRAVRARGARGDGVRLPVPRGRHRRAARGGAERGRRACASSRAIPSRSATMAERLLTDDALRDRLVAEASEHVLTFDWADVARQAGARLRRARALAASPRPRASPLVELLDVGVSPRPRRSARAPPPRPGRGSTPGRAPRRALAARR